MAANPNYDQLLTTTFAKHTPALADNVTANIILLYWLQEAGQLKVEDGGHKLVEPLMYGKGNTQSYSGYEELEVSPVEGISAAEYNWKQVATPITIDETTELKNRGKSQIINLMDAKKEQAQITIEDDLNYMFFQDGLGNGGKDLLGLQAIIDATPTTGTLGNINRANYAWWRNQTLSGAQSASAFDNLLKQMRAMYNLCRRRKQKPNLILTTDTVYEGYEGLLQPQMRYTDNKLADAGFMNIKFKDVPIVPDDDCPSAQMFMANSTYIKLRIHKDQNFRSTEFRMPITQRVHVGFILLMAQLTCSNCARQGVIHSIS